MVEVMAAIDVVITNATLSTSGGGITIAIAIAFADGDDNYVAADSSTAATGASTHKVTSAAAGGANYNRGHCMGGVTVNDDRRAAGAANNNTPAAGAANASGAATWVRKGRKGKLEERGTSEARGQGAR
jgi:Ca2+-binding RTX toxin-like protein